MPAVNVWNIDTDVLRTGCAGRGRMMSPQSIPLPPYDLGQVAQSIAHLREVDLDVRDSRGGLGRPRGVESRAKACGRPRNNSIHAIPRVR